MIPEVQTYQERLNELRKQVLQALDEMDAKGLNWQPTRKDTNSVYVLATHLIGSERHWIHENVGQRKVDRDRDAEFRARGKDAAGLRATYDAVALESHSVLAALDTAAMDRLCETPRYSTRTVRWCLLHIIEHYSEHLGHMRLTRQMWESGMGKSAKPKVKSAKRKSKSVKRRT